MKKIEAGKVSIFVLLLALFVTGVLLFKTVNLVSADNHDSGHDDHDNYTHATATPTPTDNHDHDNDCRDHWDRDDCKDHKSPTPTPTPTPTKNPCEGGEWRFCKSPSPSPTPTSTATPTIIPEPTNAPTSTPNAPVYDGKGDGLGCATHDCSGNQVGSPTQGQVLGASTMAGTGTFDETLYQAIMSIGATLSAFGLKGLKKSKKVSKK